MMGASMNSNPALFWLLGFIFSNPQVLTAIRVEVEAVVIKSDKEVCFTLTEILEKCPLLVSSWQESLRLMNATIGNRMVTEDTVLNGQYHLKKGGIIQLACGPMHSSSSIWGDDFADFNAGRFLKSTQEKLDKEKKKEQRNAYTPFGGGVTLCPGRHFVTVSLFHIISLRDQLLTIRSH